MVASPSVRDGQKTYCFKGPDSKSAAGITDGPKQVTNDQAIVPIKQYIPNVSTTISS
jgi:hypothetical protein